jgi:hypothetical protein
MGNKILKYIPIRSLRVASTFLIGANTKLPQNITAIFGENKATIKN